MRISARLKAIFLLPVLLALALFAYAQAPTNDDRDSLFALLDTDQESAAQVELLNQISDFYSEQNIMLVKDSALAFSLNALEMAKKIGYLEGEAEAFYDLGKFYIATQDKPAEATGYLLHALELFSSLGDDSGVSKCHMQLGLISYMLEYYEDAVANFQFSLEADENEISVYLMALSYTELDSIGLAKKYFAKAIEHFSNRDKEYRLSECYLYLGKLYLKTAELDSASHYINKSISIREASNSNYSLARPYAFLSEVYLNSGDADKAIQYGEASLDLVNSDLNNRDEISAIQSYQVLAQAYEAKGNFEKAHDYLKRFNSANDMFRAGSTKQRVADMKSLFEFEQEMNLQKVRQENEREIAEYEISKQRLIRNGVILGSVLLLILLVLVHNRYKIKRDSAEALLEMNEIISSEKQRSDDLLLNILPEDVAEELKSKGQADAREYDTVSILFSDFKEFTRKSEQFSPKELVAEIGACFQAFDGIMEKYGVEKIKTIGDAYMAAGGLSDRGTPSIKATVDAALEMQAFIIDRKQELNKNGIPAFEMRIGIHTGPVVAGIVGVKKFQYDLWGDTVNTASRIESNGQTGKVNISKTTYHALKDEDGYVFESRGKIAAKGKGEMDMWFVSRALHKAQT